MKKIIPLFLILFSIGLDGHGQVFSIQQDTDSVKVLTFNSRPYVGTLDSLLSIHPNTFAEPIQKKVIVFKDIEHNWGYTVFIKMNDRWEYVYSLPRGSKPIVNISEAQRFFFIQDRVRGLFISTEHPETKKRLGWVAITRNVWRFVKMPDGSFSY